ncbi:Nitroreductase-like protein [Aspergillus crustosus]
MSILRIGSRILSPAQSAICRQSVRSASPITAAAIRPFSVSARKQDETPSPNPKILVELAQARRTIYQLGNKSPVPDSKIEELVNEAILNVPSAFNTQSTRLLNLVKTGAIPESVWEKQTLPKLQGFRAGVGTILFYEDPAHIKPFSEKFALYKDQFQPWADHSNAMHQYFLWTGLKSLGLGANLQHYNPLIDAPVAKQWEVPSEWRLVAQLVFGSIEGSLGKKSQKPIEDRVKIYGKE